MLKLVKQLERGSSHTLVQKYIIIVKLTIQYFLIISVTAKVSPCFGI